MENNVEWNLKENGDCSKQFSILWTLQNIEQSSRREDYVMELN
jgi:hypothetical protein